MWPRAGGKASPTAACATLAHQITPYAGTISQWFVHAAGSVGGLFVHLLLTIAIAAVLYASGERAMDWCVRFGRRLAGERGEEMVRLAGMAIRSVALGVVVTAVAQSLVAGIGLWLAGIPQAGVLSAVILLLCIAQLGPLLVMVPAAVWLFVTGATWPGIVVVVFAVMAVILDKPAAPVPDQARRQSAVAADPDRRDRRAAVVRPARPVPGPRRAGRRLYAATALDLR